MEEVTGISLADACSALGRVRQRGKLREIGQHRGGELAIVYHVVYKLRRCNPAGLNTILGNSEGTAVSRFAINTDHFRRLIHFHKIGIDSL